MHWLALVEQKQICLLKSADMFYQDDMNECTTLANTVQIGSRR